VWGMKMIEQIKQKTYQELSMEQKDFVDSLLIKFNLTNYQKDVVCLSLMFNDTIETAFKRIL